MTTPIRAFADLAAKHGGVDPEDSGAVQDWFTDTLPTLPLERRKKLLCELLDQEGGSACSAPKPSYPKQVEMPRLDKAKPVSEPRFAAGFMVFIKRFLWRDR